MALPQQKFREIVFQILYSLDIGMSKEDDIINLIMNELAVTKKIVRCAYEKVQAILQKKNEIDALITKMSLSYEFERIQTVERNILRLGVYEIIFEEGFPPKVAIAEAIRLARKFGSPESASFVNAVLDGVYKSSLGEPVDNTKISQSTDALMKIEEVSEEASKELKNRVLE
jgi:transcription antitermination protein NusB